MFDATTEYIKTTLNSILSTITATKDVIVTIGSAISTLGQILGFIGFRVFVLLCLTTFSVWILNICSPTSRRINYFLSVVLVSWISINSKMPLQLVTFKYLALILSPLVVTTLIRFLYRVFIIIKRQVDKKMSELVAKTDFNIVPPHLKLPEILSPTILFTTLPTKDEFDKIEAKIFEKEKIALVDNDGKIIFNNENKISQFKRASEDKETNIMLFYSSSYGADSLVKALEKIPKIKQIKNIVGNGDNCFILNFLQNRWGWQVIYANNYREGIDLDKKEFELKLINNHTIKTKVIKRKIIASDIGVFSVSPISIKNRFLFLGGTVENEIIFYRYLWQILNFISQNEQYPSAIILSAINVKTDMANLVENFNTTLMQKNINFPIFITNRGMVISNKNALIELRDNDYILKQ
ncbi:MAG: hypothetical protein LBH46_03620 [Rickettsiales bacterium]|jgi:hypothetical protein|nr:hypothetical protein [Rickettsiales bacterium]